MPGVQSHPYLQGLSGRPVESHQVPLGCDHRPDSLAGNLEGSEESVALGPDNVTAVGGDRSLDDLVVTLLQRPKSIAKSLQKPRRALDVGEQERDDPSWRFGHFRDRTTRKVGLESACRT